MKIRELMTRDVASCPSTADLSTAVALMKEHDCGAIPVVQEGEKRLVGIVTDRDACLAALDADQPLSKIRVADAMTRAPKVCKVDQDVDDATRVMQDVQVRRVPVVDGDGSLLGLVSLAQVARHGTGEQDDVSEKQVARTLASISAPSGPSA